jgi:NAD+ kinase
VSLTRQLGLVANDSKPGARELVHSLVREFRRHHIAALLDRPTAALVGSSDHYSTHDLAARCELLVVLGGDGTILQVLHGLGDRLIPFFGINLGTLGFLTTVSGGEYLRAVEAIVNRNFQLSERTLLNVEILREGRIVAAHIALNDAVVSRGELSRLIRLAVTIGDSPLTEYNADGLIVATPTGSTAYSLSAGGPILTPESGVFVVNPICPHVLTNRAVITSDVSPIEIRPADQRSSIYLTLDGQVVHQVEPGDMLRITKARQTLPLAMLPEMSFFQVLRQKLKWSGAAV